MKSSSLQSVQSRKPPPANKQDTGSQKAAVRRPSSKKSVTLPTQAAEVESEEREDEEEGGEEGVEGEEEGEEEEEEEEEEEGENDDEGDSGDSESGEDSGEEEEEQDDDGSGGDDESDVLAATQAQKSQNLSQKLSGKSKLAKMTSTPVSVQPTAVSRSGSKPKRSGKVISLN